MELRHRAFLSIGSNLGDKVENCRRAMAALEAGGGIRIRRRSAMYRTEPQDVRDQDWFVNCVIQVETRLEPLELMERLQDLQRQAGRPDDGPRFGPRVLDLDILLYDDLALQTAGLTLPHPRMHRRRFVLKPLCDIEPGIVHPVLGRTARELLAELAEEGQQVVELE